MRSLIAAWLQSCGSALRTAHFLGVEAWIALLACSAALGGAALIAVLLRSTVERPKSSWEIERLRVLDPFEFEKLVAKLFKRMGYQTRHTPRDGGIDVVAQRTLCGVLHIARPVGIQVKRYSSRNKVSVDIISRCAAIALDPLNSCSSGIVITTGSYTHDARAAAKRFPTIRRIIDGTELVVLLSRYLPESRIERRYRWKVVLLHRMAWTFGIFACILALIGLAGGLKA